MARVFDPQLLRVGGDAAVLVAGRCLRCERAFFPPATRCPRCGADAEEHDLPAAGTVRASTTTVLPIIGTEPPAVVALVELDPDVVVQGVVTGEVGVGDRVRLVPRVLDGGDDGWIAYGFAPEPGRA